MTPCETHGAADCDVCGYPPMTEQKAVGTQTVLVPSEPTIEMLDAALNCHAGYSYPQDMVHGPRAMRKAEYKAMIAAAPKAAAPPMTRSKNESIDGARGGTLDTLPSVAAAAPTGEIGALIKRLDALHAQATPAPWHVHKPGCCHFVDYADGVICEVMDCESDMQDASGHAPPVAEAEINKQFISALRNAYPDLKAALTCLQASLGDAERERDEAREEARKHVGHTEYWRTSYMDMTADCARQTWRAETAERDELKQQAHSTVPPADGFVRGDTPRTDSHECAVAALHPLARVVGSNFARELERELLRMAHLYEAAQNANSYRQAALDGEEPS